jgi:hypothetical protein
MLKRVVLTNGWQFYTDRLEWDEGGWLRAKGRWDTPGGPEGDLHAPPTAIVCIRTENTDA